MLAQTDLLGCLQRPEKDRRINDIRVETDRDFPLENIVFTPIEGYGWAPLGEGTLENDRLEFYLQLLSE